MNPSVVPDSPLSAIYSDRDPDETLVQAAKGGDHAAFEKLFQRHSKKIMQSILRITKNREDAEDALQNAFLNAYLHIGSFDGRSQVSSWLMRIGINAALAVLRWHRVRPQVSLDQEVALNTRLEDSIRDAKIDVEGHYIERERVLILRRAVAGLRPSLRRIMLLQHSLDCSNRELARHTGMSVGAVKSRMLRAKNELKQSRKLARVFGTVPERG